MPETAFRRRIAPPVPLEIEFTDEQGTFKKTYKVAFDLNALARISEQTGLQALSVEMWRHIDARVLRAMLWSTLQVYHPEFSKQRTIEDVGGMLDGENQERALLALWDAYLLYLPKDEADLLRRRRAEADAAAEAERQAREADGFPPIPPATTEAPAGILVIDNLAMSSPTGSDSGPSADTTSDSPIAKSAS